MEINSDQRKLTSIDSDQQKLTSIDELDTYEGMMSYIKKRYTKKEFEVAEYFLQLQQKNEGLERGITHKISGFNVHGLRVSVIPLTFEYPDQKFRDMLDDFPFYIEKDKVVSIEQNLKSYRNAGVYIINYLYKDEIYRMEISSPARVILV